MLSRTSRCLALAVLLALIAAACGSANDESSETQETTTTTTVATTAPPATAEPQTTEQNVDGLSTDTCSTIMPADALASLGDETVECGYISVPADWANPEGDTMELAVYRVPANTPDAMPDPVVYLEGGPGGSGVATLGAFSTGPASYMRADRDVIIIDQRGTGYSIPALFCPGLADLDDPVGNQSCHDQFVADGVNLANFTSVNNAKDLGAVRKALGIDEWNLYGLSYGTRLALTAMRDEPNGIRSVILDSAFPPQINGLSEVAYTQYWAIDQIAANCDADPDCTIDAKALIEDGIERLAQDPVGTYDAASYVGLLSSLIAEPILPAILTAVATGTDAEIAAIMEEMGWGDGEIEDSEVDPDQYPFETEAVGMGNSVVCAEEFPFWDITAGPVLGDDFRQTTREVIDGIAEPVAPSLCQIWDVPSAGEIATLPVTSDIPTLILAGTADAVTPPAWSKLAGDTLANSIYLEFPGLGHGLLGYNDCVNELTESFLAGPTATLDQACLAALPAVDYEPAAG